MLTLHAILESKSKIALLALAATTTMIVGKIDLNAELWYCSLAYFSYYTTSSIRFFMANGDYHSTHCGGNLWLT